MALWLRGPQDYPPTFAFGAAALTYVQFRTTLAVAVVVGCLHALGSIWMDNPYGLLDVWLIPNDVLGGIAAVWYLFAWAVGITVVTKGIAIARDVPRPFRPGGVLGAGVWLSLNAGFFEELRYRWLILVGAPVVLALLNLVTLGLVEWLYTTALMPLANWATLGILDPQLGAAGWLVGAAVVSANGGFRKAHAYQGLFGYVNSWFVGMVLFFVLFGFGLWTAIVVHILYDTLIVCVAALLSRLQRPPSLEEHPGMTMG